MITPTFAQSLVAKGKYLVEGIGGCGNCHTARGGPMKGVNLAGGNSFGGPKAPFKSYAPNITPDPETGIGNWSDTQIITAIREGKRPDGSVIGPPMAIDFYKYMSDNDAKAIVAYLRTVKPVKHKTPKSEYRIPLHPGKPVGNVPDVSPSDKIAYGEYQVRIGHCMECHSPMVKGHPDLKNRLGAGGRTFRGPWGESVAANITPHKGTGIGAYTDAEIKRVITKGIKKDGTKLRPPMCTRCYDKMTEADLDAMVAYLKSIKPIKNELK
jgi:mono/diheme cytochrome c family protein